jgi:hypothetical protein
MYISTLLFNFISYYLFKYFIDEKNKSKELEINYNKLAYKYKKLKYSNKILHKKVIHLEHSHKITQLNIEKILNNYKTKSTSEICTEVSLSVSDYSDSSLDHKSVSSYYD